MIPSPLILASASPRRRELLGALGVTFEVRPSNVNEDPLPGETPLQTQRRITVDKAQAALGDGGRETEDGTGTVLRPPSSVPASPSSVSGGVIACDTTVLLDGEMMNKPADETEAWTMLHKLRGRVHQVQSCLVIHTGGKNIIDIVTSDVQMREYSDEEIAAYIATGDPFDKAGSYAMQHPQFKPVVEIHGCPLNVIGLALCRLRQHLPQLPPCEGVCERYSGEPCARHLSQLAAS